MKKLLSNLYQRWTRMGLVFRILVGLVLGALVGMAAPGLTGISILGKLFVSALKAIAPVLVAVLVTSSIAKAQGNVGGRFRTVISLYMISTLLAAIMAVVCSFLFPVDFVLSDAVEGEAPEGLVQIFTNLLASMVINPIDAIVNANYIGVLFWAIVIGFALKQKASDNTKNMISDLSDAISECVRWVIQFAPFGIFGLVFTSVSQEGLDIFSSYGRLLILLMGGMVLASLIINPLIVALLLRVNPYPLVWKCLKHSGLNAFFTRSSAANIPINMDLCKQLSVDRDFYSVSIPLGATINMNGAAVTITVMTLALCHTMGVEVSLGSAIFLSIVASLGACGTSGVAGGSLLLIPMSASLFGISGDVAMQAVAVGFIIGVIQDSVETALNSSGDALFTATAEFYNRKVTPLQFRQIIKGS